MRRKVIIIGAGLAGLSTGCYAQMNGYETWTFEKNDVPGGMVAAWRRKGFLVDGGIHFLMGHRPGTPINDLYRELGITETGKYPALDPYMSFLDEASGESFIIGSDLPSGRDTLTKRFPKDRRLIKELYDGADRLMHSGSLYDLGTDQVPELQGTMDKARTLWRSRKSVALVTGRYARPMEEVARTAKDPVLRRMLTGMFSPLAPEWLVMSILAMVGQGQVGLISDGCTSFIAPLVARYKELGGRLVTKSAVEGVIVENDSARGVRLDDGSEHGADTVVSAVDGRTTIFRWLAGQYKDKRIEERYSTWNPGYSMVTVSLGVNREFPGVAPLRTILLREPLTSFGRPVDQVTVRTLNYGDAFAPPGKTLVQVMFDGDWDFWSLIHGDRTAYEGQKKVAAREAILIMERQFPNIFSQVEMVDVATPVTYWRYTGSDRGSIMGWAPPTKDIIRPIPRTLPGLKDFYMAGQWSLPGGSVPTCLASGRQVVQLMCHQDGKDFSPGPRHD